MGFSAAAAQAFFEVQPPVAVGICLVGHPRDVENWVVNKLFDVDFPLHEVSEVLPVFTPIGVLIGALAAAIRHREFGFSVGPVKDGVYALVLGFLVANFGLMWGSCPIRTTILVSYGFVPALMVLGFIFWGVILAVEYIRRKVRRR